jgi:hypothetical protein
LLYNINKILKNQNAFFAIFVFPITPSTYFFLVTTLKICSSPFCYMLQYFWQNTVSVIFIVQNHFIRSMAWLSYTKMFFFCHFCVSNYPIDLFFLVTTLKIFSSPVQPKNKKTISGLSMVFKITLLGQWHGYHTCISEHE